MKWDCNRSDDPSVAFHAAEDEQMKSWSHLYYIYSLARFYPMIVIQWSIIRDGIKVKSC